MPATFTSDGNGLDLFDQWSTVQPMLRGFPAWVGGQDRSRIAAYSLYEQIYWNVPEAFKLTQRGDDDTPIYIPNGRKIVEACHRYLCVGMQIICDPAAGTTGDQAAAQLAINELIDREKFYAMFSANKRYGLIRGDWLFHIMADPERPDGRRISLQTVDPGSYFRIVNPDNVDEVIGCHIVEQVIGDDNKPYISRQTYRKETGTGGPSPITSEHIIFEVDKWGGPNMDEKAVFEVSPLQVLPAPIDALPVYHIKNFTEPQGEWGSSELRGIERLMAGINQSISDEDLALALEGLGVYTSTAGSPIDEDTGEPVPWTVGPGRVIELPNGKTFNRVAGIGSVQPFGDHLKYLGDALDVSTGTVGPAVGKVDVSVAESGIALELQFGPLFSRNDEKELEITAVLKHMLFDLKSWFAAYERMNFNDVLWVPKYGNRLPPNRYQQLEDLVKIAGLVVGDAPVVSAAWVRDQLRMMGYDIDEAVVVAAIEADRQASTDAANSRVQAELDSMQQPPV